MGRQKQNKIVVGRLPSEKEYWDLATATGYAKLISRDCVKTALTNSLFGVVAIEDGKVVGTGRVVGDGAIFYYLQDIMVVPQYQKQGIGSAILDGLIQQINKNAKWPCYVGLFTSKGLENFFSAYGFQGPEKYLYGMSVNKLTKPLTRRRRR